MVKQHLKRTASPKSWPIEKKSLTFIARPHPGPHPLEHQLSLVVVLRDAVKLVDTAKDVRQIVHNKDCLVDGVVCHDYRRPVGLMDVISLPKADVYYRILISKKNKLYALKIPKKEAHLKPCKIVGKTTLKKGLVQLNTSDGRNFLVKEKDTYIVGDTIMVDLSKQSIVSRLPFESGASLFLVRGGHVGKTGTLTAVDRDTITVKIRDGQFRTKKRFAFVVGKEKPQVTLHE